MGSHCQEQCTQRSRGDAHATLQHLVKTLDAGKMLLGHHERGGSLHGRPVETSTNGTDEKEGVYLPDLHMPYGKQDRQTRQWPGRSDRRQRSW